MPKRPIIEDSDDEDLDGFIVKDDLYKDLTRKKKKTDETDVIVEGAEQDEVTVSEAETTEETEALPEDGPELAKVLQAEAEKLTANLQSTEVNGRSLRDRSKLEKPKDTYWEKYGKNDQQKLLAKDAKKDIVDEIKALKKDYEKNPDHQETLPEDFKWPTVSARDSLPNLEAALRYVSEALNVEQIDDEETEEEEDEESSSEEESISEEETEEDSDEESEDDSDDESEDDSEEESEED